MAIRADANAAIGIGHVVRCFALAVALREFGIESQFISRTLPRGLMSQLRDGQFYVHQVDTVPGSIDDGQQTSLISKDLGADCIIVDGYCFQSDFLILLKSSGHNIALIDDFADTACSQAFITLNQNIFAPHSDNESGYLSGLKYALLRSDFLKTRYCPNRGRMLITLGGSDPDRLTVPSIEAAVEKTSEIFSLDVVVGSANHNLAIISNLVRKHAASVSLYHNVAHMAPLLARAELAIVAAGGTMWEALAVGAPMIVVHRDLIQARSVAALLDRGLAAGSIKAIDASRSNLSLAIDQALASKSKLAEISARGRSAVDGKGAQRVAAKIAELVG